MSCFSSHAPRVTRPPESSNAVDLSELVGEVVASCELEAEMQGCRLEAKTDKSAVVTGDFELLSAPARTCVRNAIRHSPKGTFIAIAISTTDGRATVSIRDHGPGVPPDALTDIFKPFYRVERDRGRSSGGVGLGLAIASRAVELHQGQITARNANPGLLVEIELPIAG